MLNNRIKIEIVHSYEVPRKGSAFVDDFEDKMLSKKVPGKLSHRSCSGTDSSNCLNNCVIEERMRLPLLVTVRWGVE